MAKEGTVLSKVTGSEVSVSEILVICNFRMKYFKNKYAQA